jgi:hypothetical protein
MIVPLIVAKYNRAEYNLTPLQYFILSPAHPSPLDFEYTHAAAAGCAIKRTLYQHTNERKTYKPGKKEGAINSLVAALRGGNAVDTQTLTASKSATAAIFNRLHLPFNSNSRLFSFGGRIVKLLPLQYRRIRIVHAHAGVYLSTRLNHEIVAAAFNPPTTKHIWEAASTNKHFPIDAGSLFFLYSDPRTVHQVLLLVGCCKLECDSIGEWVDIKRFCAMYASASVNKHVLNHLMKMPVPIPKHFDVPVHDSASSLQDALSAAPDEFFRVAMIMGCWCWIGDELACDLLACCSIGESKHNILEHLSVVDVDRAYKYIRRVLSDYYLLPPSTKYPVRGCFQPDHWYTDEVHAIHSSTETLNFDECIRSWGINADYTFSLLQVDELTEQYCLNISGDILHILNEHSNPADCHRRMRMYHQTNGDVISGCFLSILSMMDIGQDDEDLVPLDTAPTGFMCQDLDEAYSTRSIGIGSIHLYKLLSSTEEEQAGILDVGMNAGSVLCFILFLASARDISNPRELISSFLYPKQKMSHFWKDMLLDVIHFRWLWSAMDAMAMLHQLECDGKEDVDVLFLSRFGITVRRIMNKLC